MSVSRAVFSLSRAFWQMDIRVRICASSRQSRRMSSKVGGICGSIRSFNSRVDAHVAIKAKVAYDENADFKDKRAGILREKDIIHPSTNVVIEFADGEKTEFHSIWLRDHCKCQQCFHPKTKQRLIQTHLVPLDISPKSVSIIDSGNSVRVEWSNGHLSIFDVKWLRKWSYRPRIFLPGTTSQLRLWGAEVASSVPSISYNHIMSTHKKTATVDQGLRDWLELIDKHGLVFITDTPQTPEATERLARRIAFVRETHWGAFWDFTADMAHGDTAYTNLSLGVHTDTSYLTDPVGLQLFHLLEHNGKGGESLYVDGFKVAEVMRKDHPDEFNTLATMGVSAHCAGDEDIFMSPLPKYRPIINVDEEGRVFQIRFNNDDRSPLLPIKAYSKSAVSSMDSSLIPKFYAALRIFITLLLDPRHEYIIQNKPGTAVIVDNWRVLHGRKAFTGKRRLCGAYIGGDDWRSKLRVLRGEKQGI